MTRRFLRALAPWPMLGAIVATVAFVLFRGGGVPQATAGNIWDRLFPALLDSMVTNVVLLGWWMLVLFPALSMLRRPEALVRYGSPAAAAWGILRRLALTLIVGMFSVTATAVVAAAPAGWSWSWSGTHVNSGTPDASSAEALSLIFPSPLAALLASSFYLAAALFVFALAAVMVALVSGRSSGVTVIVVVYLWASLSSFGVFNNMGGLDASRAVNLPWGLYTHSVTSSMVMMIVIVLVSAFVLVRAGDRHRPRLRELLTARGASLAIIGTAAGFAALSPAVGEADLGASVARFFSGSVGDIFQYLAVMVIVLGYATGAAARISSRATDRYVHEALRTGTPTRWTIRVLTAELPPLLLVSAGVPAAVAAVYVATNPALISTISSGAVTVLFCAGLLMVQLLMYVAVIVATVWCTASASAWPMIAAIAIVFGYPLVVPFGNINVFAAFSMAAPSLEGISLSAVCASALVTAIAIATAVLAGRIRRSPAFA